MPKMAIFALFDKKSKIFKIFYFLLKSHMRPQNRVLTAKKERRLEKHGYFAVKGKFGYVKKGDKKKTAKRKTSKRKTGKKRN